MATMAGSFDTRWNKYSKHNRSAVKHLIVTIFIIATGKILSREASVDMVIKTFIKWYLSEKVYDKG